MDIVIAILGILYLCGFHVGTGLAICAIIECGLLTLSAILKYYQK